MLLDSFNLAVIRSIYYIKEYFVQVTPYLWFEETYPSVKQSRSLGS